MNLAKKLDQVEELATGNKLKRLLHHPYKYVYAQLVAKKTGNKNGVIKKAHTFFGEEMSLLLPASTDIYLTGGKTHESEIRLARFILQQVKNTDVVFDIGAHFGYFTLLFSKLAENGHVYAFEPSPMNYKLLSLNGGKKNISMYNEAVADKNEPLTFFEFPALFSESNSIYGDQYRDESWFKKSEHKEIKVSCTTLDIFCQENKVVPDFIKIDVEGAEHDVIRGGISMIQNASPVIAMEFVCRERKNSNHHVAKDMLYSMGYKSYIINNDASLSEIHEIDEYLNTKKTESDNIIFSAKVV